MRTIFILGALLTTLLGGSVATAAADASPADGRAGSVGPATSSRGSWTLSAICVHAFATASERMGSSVEPASETLAAEASDDEPMAVGHAYGTVDVAAQADDSLDAAVRACASLDDWLSAAELYPALLGSIDAMEFLSQRCDDPAARLGAFAACQSLAAALATPPPLVKVEDVAPSLVEPIAEGEHPEPTPAAEALKRTKAATRASVTRRFRAIVPGATRVRYFTIRGRTPAQLLRQNLRRARPHCGTHRAVACVDMRWSVNVAREIVDGRCRIAKATTSLRATVFLPRWKGRRNAHPDLIDWWRDVVEDSAVHEARHIRIQSKHLAGFRRAVRGSSCSSASRILGRHMRRADRAQAAFDRVEYQKPLPPLPVSLLR